MAALCLRVRLLSVFALFFFMVFKLKMQLNGIKHPWKISRMIIEIRLEKRKLDTMFLKQGAGCGKSSSLECKLKNTFVCAVHDAFGKGEVELSSGPQCEF